MITAIQALEALRTVCQGRAATEKADALNMQQGDDLSRATASGAYSAYQSIALCIDDQIAKGAISTDAEALSTTRADLSAALDQLEMLTKTLHRLLRADRAAGVPSKVW